MRHARDITAEQFNSALLVLGTEGRIHHNQRTMLRAHYRAPGRVVTAHELGQTVGYHDYVGVNRWYGELAKLVAERVGYRRPEGYTWLSTLLEFVKEAPYPMKLRPSVAKALEELGWE